MRGEGCRPFDGQTSGREDESDRPREIPEVRVGELMRRRPARHLESGGRARIRGM